MSALVAELWAWYGLTVFITGARLLSRRLLYGTFSKLGADDYIMMLVLAFFTVLCVGVHVLTYTPTNLIDPSVRITLTPDNIQERVFGSKMVIVVEQMQIMTIWSVKTCLLVMYHRLTMSLSQHFIVKLVAGYTALTFVVMEVLFFAVWCRPFWHYWAVPTDDIQCSAEHNHMITNAAFNLSSDIMIILLPMPIFVQAKLKLRRKLILIGVFALGFFTIMSAILNKYYSFSETYGTEWIYWYIREAATAIIVANLPLTWTLLQRLFNLGSFHGKSSDRRTTMGQGASRFRGSMYGNLHSHVRDEAPSLRSKDKHSSDFTSTNSQEYINGSPGIPLQIYQKSEVHVTTEAATEGSSSPHWNATVSGVTFAMSHPRDSSDGRTSNGDTEHGVVTRAYHEP